MAGCLAPPQMIGINGYMEGAEAPANLKAIDILGDTPESNNSKEDRDCDLR